VTLLVDEVLQRWSSVEMGSRGGLGANQRVAEIPKAGTCFGRRERGTNPIRSGK
jgi:hypothetical protein